MLKEALFLLALGTIALSAQSFENHENLPSEKDFYAPYRLRRSPETEEEKKKREKGWQVKPGVGGDGKNTQVGAETVWKGEENDFNAGWSKVVHGPGKAKPSWHVGGTIRWKRSPETEEEKKKREKGWQVKPGVGGDGKNTQVGAETIWKGEENDFNAGWSKVVHGPGKAKPSWHVGGTIRWKRSPETEEEKKKREKGWQVKPGVGGDGKNTQVGAETIWKGEENDFNAGWSKVVHGPGKAKPSWHVGGTIRWKRSPETEEEKKKREKGWQVKPGVGGDGKNTQVGAETIWKGEENDFNAGWSKVVHGPGKAKPSWHVGGTIRWKRSPETEEEKKKREKGWQVKPGVGGDGKNTQVGAETIWKGEENDFNAGWSKVVHGPGKAKPSWHVGGTIRWKRSPETEEEKKKREKGWQVKPGVGGDGKNTQVGAETIWKGEDNDFNAGWSKVVHGPGKAKPSWHVGGTIRWKRSPETEEEKKKREKGWQVKPGVGGDGKNTQVGAETIWKGDKNDFNAGWSNVVHGPSKAKPTWHVGGTIRW